MQPVVSAASLRIRPRWRHPTTPTIGAAQVGASALALGAPFVHAGPWWWAAAGVAFFLYGCVGLSVGYHRYYSHRAFRVARWVEVMFIAVGVLTCIGTPAGWIVMHRRHHAYSDRPGDPHRTAELGLRTLFVGRYAAGIGPHALNGELRKDPLMRWVHLRYLPLALAWPALLLALDPLAPLFLWAVPVAATLLSGSLTNYVCHKWGRRPHETSDDSRNNWVIALLYWGEGWHNNHHARPGKASFSEAWWQVDVGGWVCWALALTVPRQEAYRAG